MLVFVSGVPPILPFIFLDGIWAMRLSSIIGLVMLFAIGYRWGGYIGRSRFAGTCVSFDRSKTLFYGGN